MNNKKYVYLFKEGNETMRNLLGGKGANLAEMTILGIPVPQGFIVTTEACNKYYNDGKVISEEVLQQIQNHIAKLEEITGKKIWKLRKSTTSICKIRCKSFYARYDGYYFKSWLE